MTLEQRADGIAWTAIHEGLLDNIKEVALAYMRDAVRDEREACAKLADEQRVADFWLGKPELGLTDRARTIAANIRARGNTP